jgi:hypothetical protein
MPAKLRVLVIVMGVGILLNIAQGLAGSGMGWVSGVVGAALIVGVLRGSEGVRTLLIGLAALGLVFGAIGLALGVAVMALGALVGVLLVGGSAVSVGQNAFMIWCLRRPDVQQWMFNKSLKDVEGL